MNTSGYSITPIAKKLGIKEGYKVSLVYAPKDYKTYISPLPTKVKISRSLLPESDIVHAFVHDLKSLHKIYPDLVSAIHKDAMIWISWPKGASKVDTNLNREVIREYVLDQGLVDVKVASYDDIYSCLKFVYRLKDR